MFLPQRACVMFASLSSHRSELYQGADPEERWIGHLDDVVCGLESYEFLADIGVLEERQAGREKLFVNPRLMHLMTEVVDV